MKAGKTQYRGAFKKFMIPNTETNLPIQANTRKRLIMIDVDQFDEEESLYRTKFSSKFNDVSKKLESSDQKSQKRLKTESTISRSNCNTESSFRGQFDPRIPSEILSFYDPYELKNFAHSNTHNSLSSSSRIRSATTTWGDSKKSARPNIRKKKLEDCDYLLTEGELNIEGIDFNLINTIQKQQKKIDEKLKVLKPKVKKKRKASLKNERFEKMPIYKYIPDSSKYKEINHHKERIFSNQFIVKKKRDNSTSCSRIKSAVFHPSHNLPYQDDAEKIKKEAKKINSHISEIKRVLIQDRNFSHNSIERAIKKRERDQNKEDQYIKKEVKKDYHYTLFINNGGFKEKIVINPFGQLKDALESYDKKGRDVLDNYLSSSLVQFCRNEKFENFIRREVLRKNISLRVKKNRMMNEKIKDNLKVLDKNTFKLRHIQRRIQSSNVKYADADEK